MNFIIDRFEGDFAVVELSDGTFENLPRTLLPESAKEGDCINISIDENTTAESEKRIKSKMDRLFQD